MQSFRSDSSEYFIGTLICIDKSNNIFEVIDGQQRLTTLSLIFAKMKDLIKINTKAKGNLFERVLVSDDFGEGAKEARLKVRDLEYDLYYHYILQGNRKYLPNEPTFTEKLYIDNSEYIESYLNEQLLGDEAKLCSLARYILNQVYVVFVRTDNLVSSFRLFNVLNTRGLPLGASDLIKNNLFEVAETNNISYKKIEKYWLEIENVISVENMDKFLRLNQTSRKRDRDRASKDLL